MKLKLRYDERGDSPYLSLPFAQKVMMTCILFQGIAFEESLREEGKAP